jgi:hypothetical protein
MTGSEQHVGARDPHARPVQVIVRQVSRAVDHALE